MRRYLWLYGTRLLMRWQVGITYGLPLQELPT